MRFFTAATFFLAATAAPVDQSETSEPGQIEKRLDPITLAVVTGAASAAAGWATTEGLEALKGLIKDTSSWDRVSPTNPPPPTAACKYLSSLLTA